MPLLTVLIQHPTRSDPCWKTQIRIEVGPVGLEPTTYLSEETPLPTQDDAESDAGSTELDALIESWGLLTADDRRRIIAIVNGRLAQGATCEAFARTLASVPPGGGYSFTQLASLLAHLG